MHRPQDLFDSVENDSITGFFARMICGKTAVVRWMPILGRDNKIESLLQFVGKRYDLITMRHRQGAAGHEIILKIDQDQRTFHTSGCYVERSETSLSVFPCTIST